MWFYENLSLYDGNARELKRTMCGEAPHQAVQVACIHL